MTKIVPHYFQKAGKDAIFDFLVSGEKGNPLVCMPTGTGKSVVIADFIAPCVPLGLASGRVGNFINGELWGREADPSLPWAMVFPSSGTLIPRHPSQAYQFLGEGVLLFVILWLYARHPRPVGAVSGVFMVGYGAARFGAEYFREPDAHLGLLTLGLSMGQWLCVPMVAVGVALWLWSHRRAV